LVALPAAGVPCAAGGGRGCGAARCDVVIGPLEFIREVLVDPETGQPFVLYPAQERFLREALTLTPDGRLPYPELVFSAPKKSGKTATAAMIMIFVIVILGGPYAEGYVCANDY